LLIIQAGIDIYYCSAKLTPKIMSEYYKHNLCFLFIFFAVIGVIKMKFKKEFLGEFGGTFLMVFFGVGAVQAAVLTGAQVGLWQVAVVWGGRCLWASTHSGRHRGPI
jgi:hypothetical protein